MKVIITGAAGLLGKRLALHFLHNSGVIATDSATSSITQLILFDRDIVEGLPEDGRVKSVRGDMTNRATVDALVGHEPDLLFHLAAIPSGGAEAHFAQGLGVNLHGTQFLLEACRRLTRPPRLVFSSTVAVYGADMPAVIQDDTAAVPLSSYGSQKAASELLVHDYSRRGFIDGRAVRLPTIVVRPGLPNLATSTFASSIIREPLQGQTAVCPVTPETRLWLLSPRQAIRSLVHAAQLPGSAWGANRILVLPGLSVSVADMLAELRAVAGSDILNLIRWEPDELIQRIVGSWPIQFAAERALGLGFAADASMKEIVQAFIEDDLVRS